MEKINGLPIRNPWQMVDYASKRGESHDNNGGLPILGYLPLIDCGLGDSNEPPPNILYQILEENLNNGRLVESFHRYPPDRFCEKPANKIRQRFQIPDSVEVILDGEGSYGILAKIIWGLPDLTSIEELGLMGIGPQFANVAGLVEQHGKKPRSSYYLLKYISEVLKLNSGKKNFFGLLLQSLINRLKQSDQLAFPYFSVKPPLDLSYEEKIQWLIDEREILNGKRFIYIDNPNNPTGDFASLEAIKKLAKVTEEFGDVLIIDEAYGDYIDDNQSAIHIVNQFPHLIVLRGISKGLGLAGNRVGYMVTSREIADLYKTIQLVFSIGGPNQLVLSEGVIDSEIIVPYLLNLRNKVAGLKHKLINGLCSLGVVVFPTHLNTPILLARGPSNFHQILRRYQIVTEKGSDFVNTYSLDDSYVRIKVPGSEEEINEVLARITQGLREFK